LLDHRSIIPLKVIGSKEQGNPTASLVADERLLVGSGGAGQKQGRRSVAVGLNDNPTLVLLRLICVFDEREPELIDLKIDGHIIVADHEGNMRDALLQSDLLCQTRVGS